LLRRLHCLLAFSALGLRHHCLDLDPQLIRQGELPGGFCWIPTLHGDRRKLVAYARLSPPITEFVMLGQACQLHSEGAFGFAAEPGRHAELVERPSDPLAKRQLLAQVKALAEQ
jgi:hypothetical protein